MIIIFIEIICCFIYLFESYQVEILCFEHLYWGEILYFHLGYLYINIIIIFVVRCSSVVGVV
jgi:hypothetical protein